MERVEKERGDMFLVMLLVVILGVGLALLFSSSYSVLQPRSTTTRSSS